MPEQRGKESTSQGEQSKRQARAERILDAAATLILRWGFDKTTIDDIAREAGVAKGTIYLHWKTRDDLLMALIDHEGSKLAEDMRQRLARDPAGATLVGFVKHTTLATMKNPLMKATLLNDTATLGKWSSREYSSAAFPEMMTNYMHFLEFLREQGFVRTDISITEQTYILSAIWMGFLTVDAWMPDGFHFSDEEMAEMLAETVQRALGAPGGAGVDRQSKVFSDYLDQQIQTTRGEILKEREL